MFDHLRREVETKHAYTEIGKISRDLTWTAADIADLPAMHKLRREAIQDLSIKRLVFELVDELASILARDPIVIGAN